MNPQGSPNDPNHTVLPVDLYATDVSTGEQATSTIGNYRLIRQLGRGGMGIVYLAEPIHGGPPVALKTLQHGNSSSIARLKSEFRIVADLAHHNLVRLGELDTTGRTPFFTMEVLKGQTFDEYVRSSFESVAAAPSLPFSEDRLRHSLRQLAEGLVALHQAGLIHRDIKPSNVLVTSEGRVVILDMGLTVETDLSEFRQSHRELAGTPYFMAPEQAQGRAIGPACDWYAVGVMLFEALTGERAFQSHQLKDLIAEKRNRSGPTPRDLVSGVPADLSELCCLLLSPDPLDRPSGEDILDRLQARDHTAIASSIWIGREKELDVLRSAWGDVRQGETRVILVSGCSGIGKTALIDHFLSHLHKQEPVVVLRGRCYENEAVAYRGFDSVVDALATYLHRLPKNEIERVLPLNVELLCQVFPVLSDVVGMEKHRLRSTSRHGDPRERRQKGIEALREMLCRLSHFTALVIFVDDLQLGDDDTALIFRELLRTDEMPAALFLTTHRSEDAESNGCLKLVRKSRLKPDDARQLCNQIELSIDRLSRDESIRLASSLLIRHDVEPLENATRIADEANGDPLFIRMLVEHLVQQERTENKPIGNPAIWTLTSVIEDRVQSLNPDEKVALELLAAAGRPVDEVDLESAVGIQHGTLGIIRSLRIKRFIRRLGDLRRVEPFHDKIRETVRNGLSETRLAAHCLVLAHQVDRDPDNRNQGNRDVEFLADLYRRGGERIRAGQCYELAAAIADSTLAFRRAAEYYQFAIDLLNPTGRHEHTLRLGLANSLANASRSAEAAKQYMQAAASAEPSDRPRLQQLAAHRFLTSGHVVEGTATLRNVLEHYRLPFPKSRVTAVLGLLVRAGYLRLRGLKLAETTVHRKPNKTDEAKIEACWSAAAGFSLVDPLRGSFYIAETLCRSLRAGSTSTIPRDLAAYIGQVAIGGSRSRSATCRVLAACREIATVRREPYSRAMLSMSRGISALLRGQYSVSLSNCDTAIRYLGDESCRGATWELTTARTFALWSLQYQGNLIELRRRQPELMRAAQESDDLYAMLNYGTQVMAHLELARDCPQESIRRLSEDHGRLSDGGFFIQHHNYVLAKTYTLLYQNCASEAMTTIEGQWKNYKREFLSQVQQVRIDHRQVAIRTLIAVAETSNHRVELLARARREIALLRQEKAPWATAIAMAVDAACDHVAGDLRPSMEKLRFAVTLLKRCNMHLFETAAMHHLATITGADRSESECRWNAQQVVRGDRMAAMLIPGFGDNPSL